MPDKKLTKTEFLSQANLLKYRDETKTIDFPYQDFGFHDSLKFNKVIAYDFDGASLGEDGDYQESIFVDKNKYSKRVTKQQELNHKEIEQLLSIFTSEKYFGGLSALCFDPKLGFIFYQNDEVVNVIDICLDCNIIRGKRRFLPFKPLYTETNRGYTGFSTAFNNKGADRIIKLCKNLDFEYGNFKMSEGFFEEMPTNQ